MNTIELSSLDGFKEGDIAVLSDPGTQGEFDSSRVAFRITSVHTYANTEEDVKYTGYALGGQDDDEICMVVITEIQGFYDIALYFHYMGDNQEDEDNIPDYSSIMGPMGFVDAIIIRRSGGLVSSDTEWSRKGPCHMDLSYYADNYIDVASICEYETNDDSIMGNIAMAIYKGALGEGDLELWSGYRLQNHEFEMFPEGTEL